MRRSLHKIMGVLSESKEISSVYRDVTSYPAPTACSVARHGDVVVLDSLWSQRDLDRKEKCVTRRYHTVDLKSLEVVSQTGPQEVKDEIWNKVSPTGKLRAIVRNVKDKKNEDKQYFEIYCQTKKLKTINITALEKHGKVIGNDGQFGSFEWSTSESRILYMAEKKKPKVSGFFDTKAFSSKDGDQGAGDKTEVAMGDEFVYRETWGEQLTERVCPVICMLDIDTQTVQIVENFPQDVSPGQAMWAPDDSGVVCCGWAHEPYRLGLKFCCQRKSFVYLVDVQNGSVETLSGDDRAVRFPRFSPDRKCLVYLDTPVGGPHNQCARLVKIDWASKERTVILDQVDSATASEFQGIFTYGVSRNVWFEDNIHLALDTNWRSSTAVVIVNTETKEIKRLKKDSEKGSMSLLGVEGNLLVLSCSAPNQPHHILLAQISDLNDLSKVTWIYPDGDPETLDWLDWTVVTHTPTEGRVHSKFVSLDYESILCLPKPSEKDELPPLIVFSHGGPNSAFDTSFVMITNFFCRCGYAVAMVNYRGSIGFGQDSVLSLTGNIGTQDVQDVQAAMTDVIATGQVDKNRVFSFGGSHGGFLTTHLIGQYPETFKAAATRNPVTNLASMFSQSDIHDWVFAQAGIDFDFKSLADEKLLEKLWKASPLSHVDKVKTPLLIMIGLEDKRVPTSQGIEFYRALKARNVPIRYQTYPGNNHGISEVDAEADCMVNTLLWFSERC